jgi:hypothetical protein
MPKRLRHALEICPQEQKFFGSLPAWVFFKKERLSCRHKKTRQFPAGFLWISVEDY